MRRTDWQERLHTWIATEAATPNPYGAFVCAMSAADCLLRMTDVDHASAYRGMEFSEIAAARIVAELGGSLEALVTSMLGREPKHPALATVGDVVIAEIEIEGGRGDCIGICCGTRLRFRTQAGVVMRQAHVRRDGTLMPLARLAWSID